MATRKNVEFAKRIFADRVGDPYVYGGTWNPFDLKQGCDCSGLVTDILSATFDGTAMPWDREGLSTESYRYLPMGQQQVGPFTLMHVSSPDQIPADAVMRIDLHHEGTGGPQSHMHCVLDGWVMESNGTSGTCTLPLATDPNSSYWNDWWYVPGPLVEDDTPRTVLAGEPDFTAAPPPTPPVEPTDTLFADVSEFQVQVDDSYPYQVLSIRVCDGTYQDKNFAENYAWMKGALDSGKLTMGIVYCFVETANWMGTANTLKSMFNDNGGLHPRVVLMLDVESGGNPAGGDASPQIDALYADLVSFAGGNPLRVIGYGNVSDLNSIWITKPTGERVIVAAYGSNPVYAGEIAHQYTDGQGYGGGLPEGCPPFVTCDMNSADGLSPSAFAAACGITDSTITGDDPLSALTDDEATELLTKVRQVWDQLQPWPQLGQNAAGQNLTLVDAVASVETLIEKILNVTVAPMAAVTQAPVTAAPLAVPVAPAPAEVPAAPNVGQALASIAQIFMHKGAPTNG